MTYYDYYKSHGICVTCGQENAMPGRVRCWRCLERQADHEAEYRARKSEAETDEALRLRRERDALKRAERKANGLCPNCGRKRENEAYVACERCRQSAKRSETRKRRRDGAIPNDLRGDGIFCAICCKLVEHPGSKLCNRCVANNAENLRKARAAQTVNPWRKINYERRNQSERDRT